MLQNYLVNDISVLVVQITYDDDISVLVMQITYDNDISVLVMRSL